jgi:hypothetical protein
MKAPLLLLSLLLHGSPGEPDTDSLSAPTRADESPTALACTVESLRQGLECTFESELEPTGGGPEQAASNVRTVQGLGRALCAEAARAGGSGAVEPTLAAGCERRFSLAAEAWQGPLRPAGARVLPGAGGRAAGGGEPGRHGPPDAAGPLPASGALNQTP